MDWKLEEQRQDRLVQFAAKNRMRMRILGIICLIILVLLLAIALPRRVDRTGPHTKSDHADWDGGRNNELEHR